MPLPAVLLDAVVPDHLPWVIVPHDTGVIDLVPDAAIDCTGLLLAVVALDAACAPIVGSGLSIAYIDQAAGSIRITLTAAATATLAAEVSQAVPQVTLGYYRATITDDPVTERRTLAHGPLILRYSPEAP